MKPAKFNQAEIEALRKKDSEPSAENQGRSATLIGHMLGTMRNWARTSIVTH
jgi:hypothetical protein